MNLVPPILETERTILRMAAEADVPEIVRYFTENRDHLAGSRPLMGPEFYTEEFWRRQVHANAREFRDDRALRLFLFDRAHPASVIGNVNFTQFFRSPAHACVLGYGLARAYEGRGVMREALEVGIAYVFGELRMHRITANYVPRNERSGGLLRRLGFNVEGFARDYLMLNGRWEDHVLTSRINPDWR